MHWALSCGDRDQDTGHYGPSFTLDNDVEAALWQFILLALLLLPLASAGVSMLLIGRLERRLGIRHMWEYSS